MKDRKTQSNQGFSIFVEPDLPTTQHMDKHKDNGIINAKNFLVELPKEVIKMAKSDNSMLNTVYRDISDKLGIDAATEIYSMFKGQQISFPTRFFNPKIIHKLVIEEYDGSNIKYLAAKYGYSEKTIRRILKECDCDTE